MTFVRNLDAIARTMGTGRPRTLEWDPESNEPPYGHVLKREFSDAARHVYVPNHTLEPTDKQMATEVKRANAFVKKIRDEGNIGWKWLSQEYVPTLQSVGEFRFVCIDGDPVRVVITGRREGGVTTVENIRTMLSLREIRYARGN